ncbi:hypothetical protein BD626DRAFT_518392 [Schizophyllum amplum]|uniref:Pheromone n=1 Tax=Schizophyllum amplum TaxID=97359 RepID=A0A550BVV4_9AGAR|nr:hypothetical protein BD626DRAFT_518392 [Auriculariopsis ampla]
MDNFTDILDLFGASDSDAAERPAEASPTMTAAAVSSAAADSDILSMLFDAEHYSGNNNVHGWCTIA